MIRSGLGLVLDLRLNLGMGLGLQFHQDSDWLRISVRASIRFRL